MNITENKFWQINFYNNKAKNAIMVLFGHVQKKEVLP